MRQYDLNKIIFSLQGPCLWCSNQNRCVDKNAYIPSFPYGLCTEWTTHENKCRDLDFPQLDEKNPTGQRNVPLGASVYTKMTTCKSHRSCSDCQVRLFIFNEARCQTDTFILLSSL